MSTWFRFFDDFFDHPKTRRLTKEQRLVVIGSWCIASRSPVRGVLMINEDLPAEPIDIANKVDLPLDVVLESLGTPDNPGPVARKGMFLAWRADGVLLSPNWGERQFQSLDVTNAARQRRFREKRGRQPPEPDG